MSVVVKIAGGIILNNFEGLTELPENSNRSLNSLAITDVLTGICDQRHFDETLMTIGSDSGLISLLIIDLDQFKSFNETFGRPAGDAALLAVASALPSFLKREDLLARYGGDEFAVLMPNCDAISALVTADLIREAVEQISYTQRPVSVSIGVSTMPGGNGMGQRLVEKATEALDEAKARGNNRVVHEQRLQVNDIRVKSVDACKSACLPSPAGCLRCESIPGLTPGESPALLLGPKDADASRAVRQVLGDAGWEYQTVGPILIVNHVRGKLAEISALFRTHLSQRSQESLAAAYVCGGLATPEQIMSALLVTRPLSELLENLDYEWIREVLDEGWLFSVFHPIINANTGEVFAQEALIRARNPQTQQVLGAGQIITACEKLNLLHQMDQRARQTAIIGAAQHVAEDVRIFINFLPNTIYDPKICLRTTMEAAARNQIPLSRLVLEVVETESIPDMNHLRNILDYYRDAGVGTAIDDMGAGFTGVNYITELKPDFVKLDREFVLAAEATDEGREQLRLMIRVSHQHNARVIAEGIETEAQMKYCLDEGVDFLQGFLFAKPACPPQSVNFPAAKYDRMSQSSPYFPQRQEFASVQPN